MSSSSKKKESNNSKSSVKEKGKKKTVKRACAKTPVSVPGASNKRQRKDNSLQPAIHHEDVALMDMDAETLVQIGRDYGIEQYSSGRLSIDSDDFSVDGVVTGYNKHLMVPLVVQKAKKKDLVDPYIWSLCDTGAPVTYLCKAAFRKLLKGDVTKDRYDVVIQIPNNLITAPLSPEMKFKGINILGMGVMAQLNDLDYYRLQGEKVQADPQLNRLLCELTKV